MVLALAFIKKPGKSSPYILTECPIHLVQAKEVKTIAPIYEYNIWLCE